MLSCFTLSLLTLWLLLVAVRTHEQGSGGPAPPSGQRPSAQLADVQTLLQLRDAVENWPEFFTGNQMMGWNESYPGAWLAWPGRRAGGPAGGRSNTAPHPSVPHSCCPATVCAWTGITCSDDGTILSV